MINLKEICYKNIFPTKTNKQTNRKEQLVWKKIPNWETDSKSALNLGLFRLGHENRISTVFMRQHDYTRVSQSSLEDISYGVSGDEREQPRYSVIAYSGSFWRSESGSRLLRTKRRFVKKAVC